MFESFFAYDTTSFFDRLFHPFGDLRGLRWGFFGFCLLLWIALPFLYTRRFLRKQKMQEEEKSEQGLQQLPAGKDKSFTALLGFCFLGLMLAIPYLYQDLEWKIFNPFSERGPNRLITFLIILPLLGAYTFAQYFFERRPIAKNIKLRLMGIRALGLFLIFLLFCAPYKSQTHIGEKPYRSIALLDDSLSMGESVREFSIFSPIEIAQALKEKLSQDQAGRKKLRKLEELIKQDKEKIIQAEKDLENKNLISSSQPAQSFTDLEIKDFEMRDFVRQLVVSRAQRLQKKLLLLYGKNFSLKEWQDKLSQQSTLQSALEQKRNAFLAAQQNENSDQARLELQRRDLEDLEKKLSQNREALYLILRESKLYQAWLKAQNTTNQDLQAAGQRIDKTRIEESLEKIIENLLSTLDKRGPTRWDIASEILQPGNELSVQNQKGEALLRLLASPRAGRLTLIDILQRNPQRKQDLLPEDFALLLSRASSDSQNYQNTDQNFSLYTFSDINPAAGRTSVVQEVPLAVLDFLRPQGRTTQLYSAYNALLSSEAPHDLANVLILSDGHDTSQEAILETDKTDELQEALKNEKRLPRVMSLQIGHPRPPRILQLLALHGENKVIKDEIVDLELRIRSNANWDVELILCEGDLENEIPYQAINGNDVDESDPATKRIQIKAGERGEEKINLVRLSFTPEKEGNFRYWVKLNRHRLPGEDTYENNVLSHDLEVEDRKIRVLLIDNGFRYETRYLINAMSRDKSLEFQSFIFDAQDGWAQERSTYSQEVKSIMPPLVWPFCTVVNKGTANAHCVRAATEKEWFDMKYDVIIFGDVDLTFLSFEERRWLNKFVTQENGGIIWLAGKHHNPYSYTDPDLLEILPVKVRRPSGYDQIDTTTEKYYGLTPEGVGHEIFRFSNRLGRQKELWGERLPNGLYQPGQLDGFYWYAKIEGPKDKTSMVLARVGKENEKLNFYDGLETQASNPLVVLKDFHTGRALFVGTDEFWRMRRFFGDFFTYRFWQNSIRWAATNRLKSNTNKIDLHTDEKHYVLGEKVNVYCELIGSPEQYAEIALNQQEEIRRVRENSQDSFIQERPILLVNWRNASIQKKSTFRNDQLQSGQLVLIQSEIRENLYEGKLFPNAVGKYELNLIKEPATTKKPSIFFVQANAEQLKELSETALRPEVLSHLSGPGSAQIEGQESETALSLSYPFFEVSKLRPDLRTKVIIDGVDEEAAYNLLELMFILLALFATEWFVRKLVRLA